jgi:hypothetical protein
MVRTRPVVSVLGLATTIALVDAKAQTPQIDSTPANAAAPGAPAISPPAPADPPVTAPPASAANPSVSANGPSTNARTSDADSSALQAWNPEADEEPPLANAPVPKGRYHDGFYSRFSIGGGYFSSSVETTAFSADISGGSLAIDGMIGGSPIPGLAMGVDGAIERVFSPTVTSGDASGKLDFDVVSGLLGAFVDAFPDPRSGFHAGGIFGYSFAYLSSDHGNSTTAGGFGGGGFVGYDAWMAPELSLGLLARLTAASLSDSDGSPPSTISPISFVVAATVLNN